MIPESHNEQLLPLSKLLQDENLLKNPVGSSGYTPD